MGIKARRSSNNFLRLVSQKKARRKLYKSVNFQTNPARLSLQAGPLEIGILAILGYYMQKWPKNPTSVQARAASPAPQNEFWLKNMDFSLSITP